MFFILASLNIHNGEPLWSPPRTTVWSLLKFFEIFLCSPTSNLPSFSIFCPIFSCWSHPKLQKGYYWILIRSYMLLNSSETNSYRTPTTLLPVKQLHRQLWELESLECCRLPWSVVTLRICFSLLQEIVSDLYIVVDIKHFYNSLLVFLASLHFKNTPVNSSL